MIAFALKKNRIAQSAQRFLRDESGAVTVDWIVLTALLVIMAMASAFFLTAGVPNLADSMSSHMSNMNVTEALGS